MKKRMITMLLIVGVLFGIIFLYQAFKAYMMKRYMSQNKEPAVTVSTATAQYQPWASEIESVGSLRAVRGVNVTTELAGLVRVIQFTPGCQVKKGTLLVKLNDDTEVAQLQSLKAQAMLAKTTYDRDVAQYAVQAVSKQTVDNDLSNLKNLEAQVEQQKTIIAKKNIQAPFSGRLGISYVNPGQYVNTGDKIVTLQALDPIYVDFYLPQQQLVKLQTGQKIVLSIDTFPEQSFQGKITTIDPIVDVQTRNVQVEATIANPKQKLLPGMFANVKITTGKPRPLLTVPQTAISFNPYGNLAYIVKQKGKDKKGKPILVATQSFVEIGETRGDQISVLKGIKEGDVIVSGGQLKLKNGSEVIINNSVLPANNPSPQPIDE